MADLYALFADRYADSPLGTALPLTTLAASVLAFSWQLIVEQGATFLKQNRYGLLTVVATSFLAVVTGTILPLVIGLVPIGGCVLVLDAETRSKTLGKTGVHSRVPQRLKGLSVADACVALS